MNKDDVRALEALALASLPEDALIGKLAHDRHKLILSLEDAKVQIRATFPKRGDIARLAQKLLDEVHRQQPIRQERQALRDGMELLSRPYTQQSWPRFDRIAERNRHAKLMFGDYIRSAFNGEILSLMELVTQDCRSYRVHFLDVSVRPAISATVTVVVTGHKGAFEETFLLYKIPGTSTAQAVLATGCLKVKDAWAYQVTPAAIAAASQPGVRSKRTDFAGQAIVVVDADGDEQRFPWRGRPDEEV